MAPLRQRRYSLSIDHVCLTILHRSLLYIPTRATLYGETIIRHGSVEPKEGILRFISAPSPAIRNELTALEL